MSVARIAVEAKPENGLILESVSIWSNQREALTLLPGPLTGSFGFTGGSDWSQHVFDAQESFGIMGKPLVSTPLEIVLNEPLGDVVTFEFFMKLKRSYLNGENQQPAMHTLLKIPGVCRFFLGLPEDGVAALLVWEWDAAGVTGGQTKMVVIPELPGPEWYHVLATWDAAAGLFSMYFNGTPVRLPDRHGTPWIMPRSERLHLFPLHFAYADMRISDQFISAAEAMGRVPDELAGRHKELFGQHDASSKLPVEDMRGELLYHAELADAKDIEDWVLDAGKITFHDGWMRMESEEPDAKDVNSGHMVLWCDREFPDSFIAEWDVRIVADHIIIVFFAAKGEDGTDFFGADYPERHGEFVHYIKGKIKSYHISYQSGGGRGISNLRKNNKFYLIGTGPAGIGPEDRKVHRIRLVKFQDHIQLLVDDQLIIDCKDDNAERYGSPHGDGRIGFRHMRGGIADYRNLTIWAVK